MDDRYITTIDSLIERMREAMAERETVRMLERAYGSSEHETNRCGLLAYMISLIPERME